MLQKIRDNTQGIIAKLFIGFIIAVFALFGVETIVGTFMNASTGLKVNDVEINSLEIETLAQRKTQEFLSELGADADLSGFDESLFRTNAVNELIQRELLNQSASNSGMMVSTTAVDRRILQTEDFQVDGVYNDERSTVLLQSMGYTPSSYRALLSRETLLNQLLSAYSTTGFVTPNEVAHIASLIHQKRSFRYVSLLLDAGAADIEISDAEIAEYYEANQPQFQQEEQVKIAWLELDRESMFAEVSISEEQVRKAYDEEVASFQAQTERRAAHILFEAADAGALEGAMAEAAGIKARLDAGEDFATLAAEFSDDTGSAENGGDVGYTTGDNFVPEFEAALQALEPGQVSEPVKTEFGIHIIKLVEVNATEIEPFEARQAELERSLKTTEVDLLFLSRSEELGNLAFESVDLEEPAKTLGLQINESDWFGRSGGAGIAAAQAVIDASFSDEILEERLNSELIRVDDNRSVVIHVNDHKLPEISPLEEVKGEIAITLRLERVREQARQFGETIVSSLESGENIDSMLEAQGLAWTQLDAVERTDQRVNPAISEQVFSLPKPEANSTRVKGLTLDTGEYVVVELQSVVDGTMEDMEEGEEASLRNFISQQSSALDFAGFMTSLENKAQITGRDEPAAEEF